MYYDAAWPDDWTIPWLFGGSTGEFGSGLVDEDVPYPDWTMSLKPDPQDYLETLM